MTAVEHSKANPSFSQCAFYRRAFWAGFAHFSFSSDSPPLTHTNGRERKSLVLRNENISICLRKNLGLAWDAAAFARAEFLSCCQLRPEVHEYTVGYLHFKTAVSIQLLVGTVQRPEEMSTEGEEANRLSISCKQNEITGESECRIWFAQA